MDKHFLFFGGFGPERAILDVLLSDDDDDDRLLVIQ